VLVCDQPVEVSRLGIRVVVVHLGGSEEHAQRLSGAARNQIRVVFPGAERVSLLLGCALPLEPPVEAPALAPATPNAPAMLAPPVAFPALPAVELSLPAAGAPALGSELDVADEQAI